MPHFPEHRGVIVRYLTDRQPGFRHCTAVPALLALGVDECTNTGQVVTAMAEMKGRPRGEGGGVAETSPPSVMRCYGFEVSRGS